MEDRYLFKSKRLDNGEWVQGALFNGESHCIIGQEIKFSPYTEHECKIVGYEVDRDTICQCTGLKDKNGKLIYEGDIVQFYNDGFLKTMKIVWDNDEFDFKAIGLKKSVEHYELDFSYLGGIKKEDSLEVIGNIYENS